MRRTRATAYAARKPVGEVIAALRVRAGWTQTELARRAGVTAAAVCNIERGARPHIWLSTAAKIAAALNVSIDVFVQHRGT